MDKSISKSGLKSFTDDGVSSKGPGTPPKSILNLVVPELFSFERRSSPRAEELSQKGRLKKKETTRKRLNLHHSFDDAVELLKRSNSIVVLSGAGISTSVGIPDFRSRDNGLYHKLSHDLGISEPEDFFSNPYFIEKPAEFFRYVKPVLPEAVPCSDGSYRLASPHRDSENGSTDVPKYSPTHAFLALLQNKGKLLTNYTQNIDGLELAAGLDAEKFIQCHGSWNTASCLTCGKMVSARKYLPVIFQGGIPYCKCSTEKPEPKPRLKRNEPKKKSTSSKKRKRAASEDYGSDHSSDAYDNILPSRGLLKPNITFFEDPITADYRNRLKSDRTKIDLLIVVGTSLKVAPIQQMLYQIPPHVPQIYISKERFSGALCSLPGVQVDIELLGEADVIIEELSRRAGWTEDLKRCLWEKGMMKIKSNKITIQSHAESKDKSDYGEPTKRVKTDTMLQSKEFNIQKGLDTISNYQLRDESEQLSQQDAQSVQSCSQRTCIDQYDSASQLSSQEQDESAARSNREPVSDTKRFIKDTTITRSLEDIPKLSRSNVKIELVEGTTHQWRVTRMK